ncbi:hypothetical protein [Lewinella sp. W8]|nr:hypothetical protein [Lewinella sp. W8]MTB51296.1 hypothetical protein [Lewinella sp. W8]
MRLTLLEFPSLLGGNGDFTSWLVFILIILFVVGVLTFVFRFMQQEE